MLGGLVSLTFIGYVLSIGVTNFIQMIKYEDPTTKSHIKNFDHDQGAKNWNDMNRVILEL